MPKDAAQRINSGISDLSGQENLAPKDRLELVQLH